MKNIVVLISGTGSNLQAIIDAIRNKKLNAKISIVISNKPNAIGLEKARSAGIETFSLTGEMFESNGDYDRVLIKKIDEYTPSVIVLAGFMRILSDAFIKHYEGHILNIHPSLLPDFKGLHTHQRAIEAGSELHGASVHYVTNDLDSGPVIIQAVVPVLKDDTTEKLATRVLEQEHIIYPMAINWVLEDRISNENGTITFDNKTVTNPAILQSSKLLPHH